MTSFDRFLLYGVIPALLTLANVIQSAQISTLERAVAACPAEEE